MTATKSDGYIVFIALVCAILMIYIESVNTFLIVDLCLSTCARTKSPCQRTIQSLTVTLFPLWKWIFLLLSHAICCAATAAAHSSGQVSPWYMPLKIYLTQSRVHIIFCLQLINHRHQHWPYSRHIKYAYSKRRK